MIIGITGQTGVGKGIAADFLAQRIRGAEVKLLADDPDAIESADARVTIIPDVPDDTAASEIRRRGGRVILIYGRTAAAGRHESSACHTIDDRDFLVGNHRGMPELFEALSEVVREVERRLPAVA